MLRKRTRSRQERRGARAAAKLQKICSRRKQSNHAAGSRFSRPRGQPEFHLGRQRLEAVAFAPNLVRCPARPADLLGLRPDVFNTVLQREPALREDRGGRRVHRRPHQGQDLRLDRPLPVAVRHQSTEGWDAWASASCPAKTGLDAPWVTYSPTFSEPNWWQGQREACAMGQKKNGEGAVSGVLLDAPCNVYINCVCEGALAADAFTAQLALPPEKPGMDARTQVIVSVVIRTAMFFAVFGFLCSFFCCLKLPACMWRQFLDDEQRSPSRAALSKPRSCCGDIVDHEKTRALHKDAPRVDSRPFDCIRGFGALQVAVGRECRPPVRPRSPPPPLGPLTPSPLTPPSPTPSCPSFAAFGPMCAHRLFHVVVARHLSRHRVRRRQRGPHVLHHVRLRHADRLCGQGARGRLLLLLRP